MNRILVIQTAFLGDVILATPVVAELKRLFPNSSIDVLVKKGNESLLSNNPKINSVLTFNKSNGKWKAIFQIIRQFRKTKYDLVVNLHRFGSSGLITGLSGGKKKYGFKKNPFSFLYTKSFPHQIGDGTHEVERNLSLIKEFGAQRVIRPEMFPSEKDVSSIRDYTMEPYYCIAPASVWYTKQLPKTKWIELIQSLEPNRIFLIGGPADINLAESIMEECGQENVINLCGKLTLLESAALIKGAARNFVNDSGPLHIASAMNAPVTAFFCSTTPDFGFGPLSDENEIKEVANLSCRPCGLHGHKACPKDHFDCGNKMGIIPN